MIFCWLTRGAVERLCVETSDEATREELIAHLRRADIFGEPSPRSLVYTDHGDGLRFAAVTYFHDQHADRAFEALWRATHEDDDPMPKTMPAQRPGRSKQDVQTPPDFLAAVKRRLGITAFAFDLAASAENAVAPNYFTKEQDALVQRWPTDGWNWLNPEYADIKPWVEKAERAARTGSSTAVLIPAAVGSNWWRDHVDGKACVLLLNGRITVVGHHQPYPKDCALLLYGPAVSPGYQVWQWPLWLPKENAA